LQLCIVSWTLAGLRLDAGSRYLVSLASVGLPDHILHGLWIHNPCTRK
jgi:hypothetical protein